MPSQRSSSGILPQGNNAYVSLPIDISKFSLTDSFLFFSQACVSSLSLPLNASDPSLTLPSPLSPPLSRAEQLLPVPQNAPSAEQITRSVSLVLPTSFFSLNLTFVLLSSLTVFLPLSRRNRFWHQPAETTSGHNQRRSELEALSCGDIGLLAGGWEEQGGIRGEFRRQTRRVFVSVQQLIFAFGLVLGKCLDVEEELESCGGCLEGRSAVPGGGGKVGRE